MSKFTTRNYEVIQNEILNIVKNNPDSVPIMTLFTMNLVHTFKQDNPNFKSDLFKSGCGLNARINEVKKYETK
jgi:hypothetical protein